MTVLICKKDRCSGARIEATLQIWFAAAAQKHEEISRMDGWVFTKTMTVFCEYGR